jgi:DNA-directed RNA polymerase subunit RPC12/RpoP
MARGKSITHYCAHCERETKMEIVGAGEHLPDKTWYRCMRCRHAVLLNMAELRKNNEASKKKLEKFECLEYDPHSTYKVGEAIFHSAWDDVGKVTAKEKTSGGASAIVVSFEKLGQRRLLENVIETVNNQE